ncbi:MAG TPA: FkbM family methyltransferase [Phycisphaerae bacterium]|jgi:FkbM family methyltransferase
MELTNPIEAIPTRVQGPWRWAYRAADILIRPFIRCLPPLLAIETIATRWGVRAQPRACVVHLRCGARIFVAPKDYLQRIVYYCGIFEPHCIAVLQALLEPGSSMLDIGANIGVHALFAASKIGTHGRVYAIEAHPGNAMELRANILRNHFQNITVFETGVGSRCGKAAMALPNISNQGMYTVVDSTAAGGIEVELTTLDVLRKTKHLPRIDLIKMDIEGSELATLKGGSELFADDQPHLLIELNDASLRSRGGSAEELRKLLFQMDYVGWRMERTAWSNRRLSPIENGGCYECLFIARRRLNEPRARRVLSYVGHPRRTQVDS